MAAVDYEAEYNNRARVPEHPQIFARWTREAAEFRAAHRNAELGLKYGEGARETIDLFWPGAGRDTPLALFIHGGYWRSLEPSAFSHVARGANAHGIAVAVAGYDLCPSVTIARIIEQMQAAALFLWRRLGRRVTASGHSAGGHLAACLLATGWKRFGAPADLVPAALSISGLFDLAPLIETGMNQDLRLDAESARQVSPLFWPAPKKRTFDAWVGALESNEFLRQSRAIADRWGEEGVATRYVALPGTNHFTVLDPLAHSDSELTKRLVALARQP